MSRATPVQSSMRFDYTPRTRSGSAVEFERELSNAVSSRRSDTASTRTERSAVGTPVPATSVVAVAKTGVDTSRQAGNPFAASGTPVVPPAATPPAATVEPKVTSWCPWNGPCDPRDAIPAGGGQRTTSGAPKIEPNAVPTRNQYNYTGPASRNPYFTNPGNPLRSGYVSGFDNWFLTNPAILGPTQSTAANPSYFATQEGAQEALRLVQQFEPGAQLASRSWGGGPFLSNQPMYFVQLPNGRELNAGGVLAGYYNQGTGVTIASDNELQSTINLA